MTDEKAMTQNGEALDALAVRIESSQRTQKN